GDDVGNGVDNITPSIAVKVYRVFFKCSRHKLCRAECSSPRTHQAVRPDITALEYLQRRQKFFAEIILAAANAGKRCCGPQDGALTPERAVVGLDAPYCGDGIAIDSVCPLHRVKDTAILFKQSAA